MSPGGIKGMIDTDPGFISGTETILTPIGGGIVSKGI